MLPSWIRLCYNGIDCEFSCKLCYWKSFAQQGLSKSANDCPFMMTNFIKTKKKMHLQNALKEAITVWQIWMLIHVRKLFLNVPYGQMKVILVLKRVYWLSWNKYGHKWMAIFCTWTVKGVINVGCGIQRVQKQISLLKNSSHKGRW